MPPWLQSCPQTAVGCGCDQENWCLKVLKVVRAGMLTVSSLLSLVITAAARWRDSRLARKCDHKKHKLLTGCPGKWHSKVMLISSNIPSIFTFIEATSTWPKWQTWPILTFILFIKFKMFLWNTLYCWCTLGCSSTKPRDCRLLTKCRERCHKRHITWV